MRMFFIVRSCLQHLDAVDLGHRQVEREDVGLVQTAGLDRLATVGDLGDDLDARRASVRPISIGA